MSVPAMRPAAKPARLAPNRKLRFKGARVVAPISLGQRLREERFRLGLSEEVLAAFAGITATAVRRFEEGGSVPPPDFFHACAVAGADEVYIRTGLYSTRETLSLSPIEKLLLSFFRNCPEASQEYLLHAARAHVDEM
jgi:transcriptional regulator with XRE-family HTH domain